MKAMYLSFELLVQIHYRLHRAELCDICPDVWINMYFSHHHHLPQMDLNYSILSSYLETILYTISYYTRLSLQQSPTRRSAIPVRVAVRSGLYRITRQHYSRTIPSIHTDSINQPDTPRTCLVIQPNSGTSSRELAPSAG